MAYDYLDDGPKGVRFLLMLWTCASGVEDGSFSFNIDTCMPNRPGFLGTIYEYMYIMAMRSMRAIHLGWAGQKTVAVAGCR